MPQVVYDGPSWVRRWVSPAPHWPAEAPLAGGVAQTCGKRIAAGAAAGIAAQILVHDDPQWQLGGEGVGQDADDLRFVRGDLDLAAADADPTLIAATCVMVLSVRNAKLARDLPSV